MKQTVTPRQKKIMLHTFILKLLVGYIKITFLYVNYKKQKNYII